MGTEHYNLPQIDGNASVKVPRDVNRLANAVDETLSREMDRIEAITGSFVSGSPKGAYPTLSDLQSAYPAGNSFIYVITADGKWYYWSGSTWTAGGTYQATNISENAIRVPTLDNVMTSLVGIIKLNLGWVRGAIQSGNINTAASNGAVTNNFIDLDKDLEFYLDASGATKYMLAYYTTSGVFTGVYSSWYTGNVTIPADATRKIRVQTRYSDERLNVDVTELTKYLSIVKKKNSVDLIEKKVTTVETRVNQLENPGGLVPSHWESHIASKVTSIQNLQKSLGFDGTSFAFITDIHWNNNSKNSPYLLKRIMQDCDIPYYIDGGDFAANPSGLTKQQQIDEIKAYKKAFSPLENRVVRTIGNHDDNSINNTYSQTIADKEMYDLVFRQNGKYPHMKSGRTGEYYFIDDTAQKMRYITLNCVDIPYINNGDDTMPYTGMNTWAFRQAQIDWFADVALKVPDNEWHVVVCSHIPINYGYIKNDSIAMNILQAFKDKATYSSSANIGTPFEVTKSVDFSGKGGQVICWLAGHIHTDTFITLPGHITFKEITTLNDSLHVATNAPTKALGSITENAFDVFTVDKLNKTVTVTRIGAGSNRTFTF